MRALLVLLVTALVVASASAGCFGKDKKKDDGTQTTTTTTNTTTTPPPAPNLPPVPVILVNGTAPPANGSIVLTVSPNANFTINFDGSGSTDPDGNITNFAWIITGPKGFQPSTGTNVTFDLAFVVFSHFGKFDVTLRALDDGNALASVNTTFYVNYVNSFDSVPIPGPGTGDNADPNDAEYGCVSPPVCTGTYSKHGVTVKANATAFEVDIAFKETAAGATLTLRVFDPSQDIEGDANALMQEKIASTGGTFTASDISKFSSVGTYTLRLDVDGAGVESYDLTVRVKYDPQAA